MEGGYQTPLADGSRAPSCGGSGDGSPSGPESQRRAWSLFRRLVVGALSSNVRAHETPDLGSLAPGVPLLACAGSFRFIGLSRFRFGLLLGDGDGIKRETVGGSPSFTASSAFVVVRCSAGRDSCLVLCAAPPTAPPRVSRQESLLLATVDRELAQLAFDHQTEVNDLRKT